MGTLPFDAEKLTVLVVDDHDPMRKGIRRVLNKMGFENIIEKFDGDGAEETLQLVPVDLVITDIFMQKKNGFDLLRYIRSRTYGSEIPVIVVTGEATKDDIIKAHDLGASDYLVKPFQAEDLERKIVRILGAYLNPSPMNQMIRKCERQLVRNDSASALQTATEALSKDPESVVARHLKAVAMVKLNKVKDALVLLKMNADKHPEFYKTFAVMADVYVNANLMPAAIKTLEKELKLNPRQPERQILMGRLLVGQGYGDLATQHYREALKDEPRNHAALMGAGHALAKAGNIEKAIHFFMRARRYHPKSDKPLPAIVKYCRDFNILKKAEHILIDEKRMHPDRLDTYIELAQFLKELQREEDASEVLQELLHRDPENVAGLTTLGKFMIERGDYTGAVDSYRRLVNVHPEVDALLLLSRTLIQLEKYGEAIGTLTKALAKERKDPYIYYFLAECFAATKQICKAYMLYRKAIAVGFAFDDAKNKAATFRKGIMARHTQHLRRSA